MHADVPPMGAKSSRRPVSHMQLKEKKGEVCVSINQPGVRVCQYRRIVEYIHKENVRVERKTPHKLPVSHMQLKEERVGFASV